ncbi:MULTISPECIES: hypothetical protein [Haloterrigena]|uniref:Uncharacterized protein n=2 Tax=Haloterrigena TaxID=121871 RepID=M0CIL2_9EURY|nr:MULTISPECIES: hypothetical protein [Haloterrigena]ELZ22207.1 hypothetical protein C477_04274 [Haloterrigena salina JCM 13891]QRV16984.1 hypothetical protein JMJ58_09010 [Haloterrigena salifodinae]
MMWQDFIFMIGSGLSIIFLAPTLRDASARVPLGTSLPSMAIGFVYGMTFLSLGMSNSAMGSLAAGTMWALIAMIRSPTGMSITGRLFRLESPVLFASDLRRWLTGSSSSVNSSQFVPSDADHQYRSSTDGSAD